MRRKPAYNERFTFGANGSLSWRNGGSTPAGSSVKPPLKADNTFHASGREQCGQRREILNSTIFFIYQRIYKFAKNKHNGQNE